MLGVGFRRGIRAGATLGSPAFNVGAADAYGPHPDRGAQRELAADLTTDVLVILPRDQNSADAVIDEGVRAADSKRLVFLYRGQSPPGPPELWEVSDPYLKDYVAQDAFMRAEIRSRDHVLHRRYVYVPGSLPRDAIGRVWTELRPHETVVAQGEQDALPPVTLERVRHRVVAGVRILHLVSSRITHHGVAAAS